MPKRKNGRRANKDDTENGAGTSTSTVLWSIGENIFVVLPFIFLERFQLNVLVYINTNGKFDSFFFVQIR